MTFEWDSNKDRINRAKHGIGFDEASQVFETDCLELFDDAHSDDEERFITIGPIAGGLVLVVWTERPGPTTRIISARWATQRERRMYRRVMGKDE